MPLLPQRGRRIRPTNCLGNRACDHVRIVRTPRTSRGTEYLFLHQWKELLHSDARNSVHRIAHVIYPR